MSSSERILEELFERKLSEFDPSKSDSSEIPFFEPSSGPKASNEVVMYYFADALRFFFRR